MLNIYFGNHEKEIYHPALYFKNTYEGEWITSELGKAMILDIDKSEVLGQNIIDSPVFGGIGPERLSGGVKTLLLLAFGDTENYYNASACGDNCANWILKIAKSRDITITLHHILKFVNLNTEIRILNTNEIVTDFRSYATVAMRYV